jgi:hypothetical protein
VGGEIEEGSASGPGVRGPRSVGEAGRGSCAAFAGAWSWSSEQVRGAFWAFRR